MRILLLSDNKQLCRFLEKDVNLVIYPKSADYVVTHKEVELMSIEMIISFGYRIILAENILNLPRNGSYNLHISYLPYNRGADPNVWSHLDGTPSGVTLHRMDKGIDTGSVVTQKIVQFDPQCSLKTTYDMLIKEAVKLFKEIWPLLKTGVHKEYKQLIKGTYHQTLDKWDGIKVKNLQKC